MKVLYSDEPIIACSSGTTENCAISIIRISGFKNLNDLDKFFSIDLNLIKERSVYYTNIVFKEIKYDEIVLTYFKGPKSYNGENILELSVHGNMLNVNRIINLFCDNSNLRRAYPGEFTYRALNNNKMSLSQVEGLDLLLNASSKFSLSQGFSLMSGKLQDSYLNLEKSFLKHKSSLELSIDFLEDIGEEQADILFRDSLNELLDKIQTLKNHCDNQGYNLLNPEVTLVGLPNSGKSTLFNKLLKNNRAIVSDIAGTTRDYITENLNINNTIFKLVDTAGIRKTNDNIEYLGIQSSLALINKSFFKILLINPFQFTKDFFSDISHVNFDIIIFTHNDLENFAESKNNVLKLLKSFCLLKNDGPIEPRNDGPIEPRNGGPIEPRKDGPIEPKNDGPIEPLILDTNLISDSINYIDVLKQHVNNKYLSITSTNPILLDRHKELINNIYLYLSDYSNLSKKEHDISILSHELNAIGHCISELIGIVSPDDVLHNIFDNFCIGK